MLRTNLSRLALVIGLMVPIGFALGTAILLGPVRWITSFLREKGAPNLVETLAVVALIVALVLITAAVAWVASGYILNGRLAARVIVPVVALGLAGAAWALWMDTSLVASLGASGGAVEVTPGFTFGPYPEQHDLQRLKEEGFTGVISLLHPAVVPFEPQLLQKERQATQQVGIPFIHLPMLPWISSNDESLQRLAALAREGEGRYYVHCYLGRDRVRLAQRIIESNLPEHARVDTAAMGEQTRLLVDGKTLERGLVQYLDEAVVIGPYPTPEEFSTYIVGGGFDHVVSLMAPTDAGARKRIEEERAYLEPFPVTFTSVPLASEALTDEALARAVNAVRGLEGRVYVHAFFSVDNDRSQLARRFAEAYRGTDSGS